MRRPFTYSQLRSRTTYPEFARGPLVSSSSIRRDLAGNTIFFRLLTPCFLAQNLVLRDHTLLPEDAL